jgi:hypothetical protein
MVVLASGSRREGVRVEGLGKWEEEGAPGRLARGGHVGGGGSGLESTVTTNCVYDLSNQFAFLKGRYIHDQDRPREYKRGMKAKVKNLDFRDNKMSWE